MALWLQRAGRHGEHENKFLTTHRIYLTWGGIDDVDLTSAKDYNSVKAILGKVYGGISANKLAMHAAQIWKFVGGMKPGDLAIVPLKQKSAVAIAEITGPYEYNPEGEPMYRHSRKVRWLVQDVPRSAFDADLRTAFCAMMTIAQIHKKDGEERVRAMAKQPMKPVAPEPPATLAGDDPGVERLNIEEVAQDQIATAIAQKFAGHGFARLVEAILRAQGYTTYRSPEGPDKGVDILAAPGPLGFGNPRLCVQVKSGGAPVDTPTLNQLIGSMQNVKAEQGLLVSWGGFKSSVHKEVPVQFFRVRLWDQAALIQELLANYDKLDEDLRAELPLKRIWSVAIQEEEG